VIWVRVITNLMLLSVVLVSPQPSNSGSAGRSLGSPAAFSPTSSLYPGKASQAANPAEPLHLEIKALHGTDRVSLGEARATRQEGGG
jgi:hypothetical protein